jgi:preprotein translocase subunit SecE
MKDVMTDQADMMASGGSARNTVLALLSVAILIGGLVAYYAFGAAPMALRTAGVVGSLIVAAAIFAVTSYGRGLWQFAIGSRVELRKMVWPTVPETRTTTLVVFVFVVVLGAFFWIIDWVLAWGTRHLLGTGA